MARKRKRNQNQNQVPQTAEEKAARKALTTAQQLTVEQTKARQVAGAKGAFRQRSLRAGGSELQRYDLQRFTSDPFPTVTVTGPGGYNPTQAGPSGGTGARTSPKPKRKKGSIAGKGGGQERGEIKPKGARERPSGTISNPGAGQLQQERRREAEARKREEERKKAEARRRATQQNKDQGTYRSPSRSTQTAL